MDGQVAHQSGQSKWITNEESRLDAHRLRSRYDAVLIGKNTLLVDNPHLNIRVDGIEKINKIIILDPSGESIDKIHEYNIAKHRPLSNIYVVVGLSFSSKESASGINIVRCPQTDWGALDLNELNKLLFSKKIYSAFVEGGANTISEFFRQRIVDRFFYFIAPTVIGAKTGISWSKDYSIEALRDRFSLRLNSTKVINGDVLLDYSSLKS